MNADSKKTSTMHAAREAAFHKHRASDGLWATHLLHHDYIPQSREAHRQHTAAPVQEAREAPPKELFAAILMLTARSEATSTTIDVERPNLRSCLLRSSC